MVLLQSRLPLASEVMPESLDQVLIWVVYSTFRKYSDENIQNIFSHFVMLQSFIKTIKKSSLIYTNDNDFDPIMTSKNYFCKFIKKKTFKYDIEISIQTICYDSRNYAQAPPTSLDHLWDASTPWLESACGKFSWLEIIWKGTHLSI